MGWSGGLERAGARVEENAVAEMVLAYGTALWAFAAPEDVQGEVEWMATSLVPSSWPSESWARSEGGEGRTAASGWS